MHKRNTRGFTIVELLIVIVVIGILAAITVVAYNGTQQRARDTRRQDDVGVITKALELYYIDNGKYPAGSGSTVINNFWSTTADGSWSALATALRPYLAQLPPDPVSTASGDPLSPSGYNYAYFAGSYCGAGTYQMYILVYRLEGQAQKDTFNGSCATNPLGPYGSGGASNYRMSKA